MLHLADRLGARWLVASAGWFLWATACGPVEPDHPLDPQTPPELQQPSRLSGTLIAPGGADPEVFTNAHVELSTAEQGADGEVRSALAHLAPVDGAGRFRFDAVQPGVYRLDAYAEDLAADPMLLSVPFGALIDLGALILEPQWGRVMGRVIDPAGQPIPGATIEANNIREIPGADGTFELTLPAGPATLWAEAPGHEPIRREVDVAPGAVTSAGAALVLVARPAALSGQVDLRRFGTAERRAAILVELNDGEQVAAPVDGRFDFGDLPTGPHRIIARATGYDPVERNVTLAAGEQRTLDPIELPHVSSGPRAVWLEAAIDSADTGPLWAVSVVIRLGELPFARVATDRDGRIAVPAAREDRYWLDVRSDGFAPTSLGPLIWSADAEAFLDIEGDRPHLRLQPTP